MTQDATPAIGSRQQFFNDATDIAWLHATHLKGIHTRPFKSFILIGNEDSPDALYLYESADPLVTDSKAIINFEEITA